jgi:hypothetical protein
MDRSAQACIDIGAEVTEGSKATSSLVMSTAIESGRTVKVGFNTGDSRSLQLICSSQGGQEPGQFMCRGLS